MITQYNQVTHLKNFDCFAITFKEFLNWSAYGVLRINRSRIHYFDGEEDTFNLIMDSSPDVDVNIKGEYLFIHLISDYQKQIYQRTTTDYYLKLEAVKQFFVMDDHAYQLLIGRANAAKVSLKLDEDMTGLAKGWIKKHKSVLNAFKALRFVSVLGFNEADFDIDSDKSSHLENFKNHILKSYQDIYPNIKKYYGKLIYSYRFLNEYTKNICSLESEHLRDYFNENENFKILNSQLSEIDIAKDRELAISDYQYAFEERLGVEKFIRQELGKSISDFLLMTLYVHYKVLIEEYFENFGEDIVIAFVKDLKKLQDVENNNNNAKVLAYEIGSLLPEVFVNHLYYVKNKEMFSALNDNLLNDVQKTLSNITTVTYKIFSVESSDNLGLKENSTEDITTEEKVRDNDNQSDATVNQPLVADHTTPNMTELQEIIIQFFQKDPKRTSLEGLMEHIHQINKSYSEQDVESLYSYLFNDKPPKKTPKGKLSSKSLRDFKKLIPEQNIDNLKISHTDDSEKNTTPDLFSQINPS